MTLEFTLLALLPLVMPPPRKTKTKQTETGSSSSKPKSKPKSRPRSAARSAGRQGRSSSGSGGGGSGSGLLMLHAAPFSTGDDATDSGSGSSDSGSDIGGTMADATGWRVSLSRSFVPPRPKTSLLLYESLPTPTLPPPSSAAAAADDVQSGADAAAAAAAGGGSTAVATAAAVASVLRQLQRELRRPNGPSAEGEGAGAPAGTCDYHIRASVSLRVRKVVPVCLWVAD